MALPKVQKLGQIQKQLSVANRPIIRNLKGQIGATKAEQQAFTKGLEAQQGRAFGQITQGASNRGLLFSGIPLGEQAEYTATEFLPALARGKAGFAEQRGNIRNQLLGLNKDTLAQAMAIREQQLSRFEQARQFQEQLEESRRQAAAARAAASSGGFGGFDVGDTPADDNPADGASAGGGGVAQQAQANLNAILARGRDYNSLRSDMLATLNSAKRGNKVDQAKYQMYKEMVSRNQIPNIFSARASDGARASGPSLAQRLGFGFKRIGGLF